MANKIVITNQKGGVGKTSTAINLADALIHCNYNVLFVDLDPSCNSSSTYKTVIQDENTIYDLMNGRCSTKEAIQTTEFGDIISGDSLLAEDEYKFLNKPGGYNIIKKALKEVDNLYDYIIMDTPPNLGIFMVNALTAADGCIIPIKADAYSIDGMSNLIKTINDVMESSNPNLAIYGVLLTHYDKRANLDKQVWNELPAIGEQMGLKIFKHPISICQDIKKAQSLKQSLFEFNINSQAAYDYKELAKEILEVK